jgi:type VI secretion system protein ImpL
MACASGRAIQAIRLGGTRAHVEQLWKSNVLPFCHRALDKRYPFERSVGDVTLQDFTRLFALNGLLDEFFKTIFSRSTHLHRVGVGSGWRTSISVCRRTPVQFQRAQQIRDAFSGPAQTPSRQVRNAASSISTLPPRDVTVEIDGQTATLPTVR